MFKNPAAYVKAYAAWIGGILSAVIIGAPLIGIDIPPYVALVSLIVTAVAVEKLPNLPAKPELHYAINIHNPGDHAA